ncbi:hypothetical protein EN828_23080 [Mesorhizobium sp. M2D.F.Ca.ET.185.01.1.1]|nr:hypothetical protein EN783_24310 [Mesorhizobium sp. M2D.F.Ca.ET.140.01.1.1]TGP15330.1 hypothetical protein EN876_22825 [Mesorhizobium sp. M2D.F.Ca.ET.233.01.1.1]TGP29670.1 hypothetical protein EN875_027300 [Mesorhizobium sp. M2D.F.Ca.ET.232.01.1.1]TGP56547.1 hypothetical protein EN869_022940 [Mesorhizobium sp. M2D.F.Ca.ET.226.01.1.1]TGP65956.1 hypothetical protein EN868_23500 [Mesorhizobium sp. M2D.F.Ca.ET.225.01.1.1]TGP71371.1 hypothetical protein EN867_26525 [Mesorhizobium sp. M2D.F.Ca.ET
MRPLKAAVEAHVKEGSIVLTDEFSGYSGLSDTYYHQTVNHSGGEYSRGYYFHINSIEGAWSLSSARFTAYTTGFPTSISAITFPR